MAPTDHTLEQEFAQVVRDYFPRWRSAAQWTVTAGAGLRWQRFHRGLAGKYGDGHVRPSHADHYDRTP